MRPRERWRDIPGLPGYQASTRGRVRSVDRVLSDGRQCGGAVLAQARDADGYWRVKIGGRPQLVHRLVLLAFAGPCPPGMEGCHGNGQDDNTPGSLRWDTHAENERDKRRQPVRLNSIGTPRPVPAVTL